MLGGQEHELTMRTAELIEENSQQTLDLLIRYATSSRTSPHDPPLSPPCVG